MVSKPGIYQMDIAAYVADPCPEPSLNASTAHRILEHSPKHAWFCHPRLNPNYEREESSRMELGTIAHALLLENDSSRVVVIDADNWMKKETKEKRDAARAEGKLPILKADHESVIEMVDVAKTAIAKSELAEAWNDATAEQTLLWVHEGVWCRSRPDKASRDWRVLFDYKTCAGSAHPSAWGRSAITRHGLDIQAQLAIEGVERLCDPHDCKFIFVVQEIEKPYAVALVSLAPTWLALAKDKLHAAMSIWKGCLRMNEWQGHPSQVAYLEPPPWIVTDWADGLPPIEAEDLV